MMPAWLEQLQLQDRPAPSFLRNPEQLRDNARVISGAYAVENAWLRMGLDGVVCCGAKPLVYIKHLENADPALENNLHHKLWNQDVAPILLIVDPSQIRVYSARPKRQSSYSPVQYIEALDRTTHALEARYLISRMESGEYFDVRADFFHRGHAVDRTLLNHLTSARDELHDVDRRLQHDRLHRLLVCALFIRYLRDRGALDSLYFERRLAVKRVESVSEYVINHKEGPRAAYSHLFTRLGEDLGGDLLSQMGSEILSGPLKDEHFLILNRFLQGETKGQLSLGDWVYDLSLIPAETISAIYQEFLSVEVPNAKKNIGSVATPRFIAEVMLARSFLRKPSLWNDGKILDPACGSGVFLVAAFNRIAYHWKAQHPDLRGVDLTRHLARILHDRIFGIDINATSCHLTNLNLIQSLLAHLDSSELHNVLHNSGQLVPPLTRAVEDNELPNITNRDFFAGDRPSRSGSFALVVGNPPWSKNAEILNKVEDATDESEVTGGSDVGLIPARGNLAHLFAQQVPTYLEDDGLGCLLLDAKAMLASAPGRDFLTAWFKAHKVEEIINLTNLRAFLFENAGRSGAVFYFRKEGPRLRDSIAYQVPLPARSTRDLGVLNIAQSITSHVSYRELDLATSGDDFVQLWKTRQWGSSRDVTFIQRLKTYPTLKQEISKIGFLHQGFNRHGGSGKACKRELLHKIPFLPTDREETGEWSLVLPRKLFTRSYGKFKNEIDLVKQWPSDEDRLFSGERIVIHHSPISSPPLLCAALATEAFTFHKEIQALYFAPGVDSDLLRLIVSIINSSVAAYFLFHTSLSWGIEAQPQVRKLDILSLPMPEIETPQQRAAQQAILALMRNSEPKIMGLRSKDEYGQAIKDLRTQINDLVYQLFGVSSWERDLIEHFSTFTYPLSLAKKSLRLQTLSPTLSEKTEYANRILDGLRMWSRGKTELSAKIFTSKTVGLGLIEITRHRDMSAVAQVSTEQDDDADLDARLTRLRDVLQEDKQVFLPSYRDVLIFHGDSLYLTKPLLKQFWSRATALVDADLIGSRLLSRHLGRRN
jgi:hypothetical protein